MVWWSRILVVANWDEIGIIMWSVSFPLLRWYEMVPPLVTLVNAMEEMKQAARDIPTSCSFYRFARIATRLCNNCTRIEKHISEVFLEARAIVATQINQPQV